MDRPRSVQHAVIALISISLLGGALLTAPARAADLPVAPSVTIVSPSGAGPVGGTVTFAVSINQPDTAHPVNDVYLEIYGSSRPYSSRQDVDIPVAAGQCDPTCTISADFDTKTLVVPTNPDPSQYLPDLPDGVAEFAATVGTSFGPTGFASADVDIENHRPILTLPDLPTDSTGSSTPWTGVGSISTRVATTLSPEGGTSIISFRLMVPHSPASFPLADLTVAAPADGTGTGTITVDTSQVLPNPYVGYLVAMDSDGVASNLVPVWIIVPDPYHITARIDSATAEKATITVVPRWLDRSTASQTWLTDVSVYEDGVLLGSGSDFPNPHDSATLTVPGPDGGPFPAGDVTLTVTAVDNRGIPRSATQNASTTDPLSPTWTTAKTIIEGAPSGIDVTVTDTSKSQLQAIVLKIDGVRVGGVANPSPTLEASVPANVKITPGPHDVTATVLLTNGQQYTFHRPVVAYGHVAVGLSAPASTAWGNTSTFRSSLIMDGKAQTGAPLLLQSRAPGSTTWITRASARTNSTGVTTFHVAASLTGTATWRVDSPAGGYRLSGVSASRIVPVTAQFGPLPPSATTHRYQAKRFVLSVAPHRRGVVTTVEYLASGQTRWSTLKHATVSATGGIDFTVSFAKAQSYRLRVMWPSMPTIASTTSRSWLLRVIN